MTAPFIARAAIPADVGPRSIWEVVERHARIAPDSIAVVAPDRPSLTYSQLGRVILDTVATLRELGIGRAHRVGLVLPNGPEMAVAFLAVAAAATAAPLNPAASRSELEHDLRGLRADAVIVPSGLGAAARAAAYTLDLPVLELTVGDQAGTFTLAGPVRGARASRDGLGADGDLALLLRTSGSTSTPKVVPLTHRNICRVAHDNAAALRLTPADRCLAMAPLFHAHGLLAVTLTSAIAGASVVYPATFEHSPFFGLVERCRPSWYSAVPAIHQAVLIGASSRPDVARRSGLRLIRSGSAQLPPSLRAGLEERFGVPVREAYGMTEVSPITYTPEVSRAGSVGEPVGADVAIMDGQGRLLSAGEPGEVVARGPALMRGYEGDPADNAGAFADGWFRTGDTGYLDAEGFLFLSGRAKETINRGGEKIQPAEVDAALLEHPAVAEALTFAVPHPSLGEDVAAVVVLRDGAAATARDIRTLAAQRLSLFKVPQTIVLAREIPKDAVGKTSRRGLAERLGLLGPRRKDAPVAAPRTDIERSLAVMWSEVLGVEAIGLYDSFFALGGDSLRVPQLLAAVREALGVEVPVATFLESPTLADLADAIESGRRAITAALADVEALSDDEAEARLDGRAAPGAGVRVERGETDPGQLA